ncbi:uncharacterized protein LOC114526757 [Dendronephthya gigantea]|uniref:uncharacterized protein LOC114526757 n=1 Tax=Dendronephthya gigantea TaxID=151771 RepID=UPI00106CFDC5|nr:uncharacterized protein LOC114526757 [Dendronephthya gigantea]
MTKMMIYGRKIRKPRKKKRWWVAPGRTDNWRIRMTSGEAPLEEWNKNFRMSKENFVELVNELRPFITLDPNSPRLDTATLKMTANAFGISVPTTSKCVKNVCKAIKDHLGLKYIKIPAGDELIDSIKRFEDELGFPQVLGAVDGTHVPIVQPNENSHSFFSFKMKYTLNAQAVCDSSGKFIDVEIRWPGGTHDAKVFANSGINRALKEGTVLKMSIFLLLGRDAIPLLLLGDPAYPLLPHCMKKYSTCYTNEQVIFNQMLRSARNKTQNSSGQYSSTEQIATDAEQQPTSFVQSRYLCNTAQGVRTRDVITTYFKEYLL